MSDIVQRLRELRVEQGITPVELAKRMNVSPGQISNLETRRNSPLLATLERWATALGAEITLTTTGHTK